MAQLDLENFLSGVQVSTTASKPAASAANRGRIWIVQGGAGVADTLQVCIKNASDSYVWVTVTAS